MAEDLADGLFAIEVDADDYAETAAGDIPSVPRTFQSEADFQVQKASYSAKIHTGNNYAELLKVVPDLSDNTTITNGADGEKKKKLGKKEFQLLGYAVGEMYYEKKYEAIVELCGRVRERCEVDARVEGSLGRWVGKCRGKMGKVQDGGAR